VAGIYKIIIIIIRAFVRCAMSSELNLRRRIIARVHPILKYKIQQMHGRRNTRSMVDRNKLLGRCNIYTRVNIYAKHQLHEYSGS